MQVKKYIKFPLTGFISYLANGKVIIATLD